MKTAKEIKDKISDITNDTEKTKDVKLRRSLRKELPDLRLCFKYLETNPSEEFIKKEISRLNNRVKKFMESYVPLDETRFLASQCARHKKDFCKEMGLPHIKVQLRVLNYLIS